MVRITRNFEYFDGVIDNGYQELELTKEEWDSMEEYEREELAIMKWKLRNLKSK